MSSVTVDPFDILENPAHADILNSNAFNNVVGGHDAESTEQSWQERAWLILFDVLIALALLFLLSNSLPVAANSNDAAVVMPALPTTDLVVTLKPVGYQESAYGLSYEGSIEYMVHVANQSSETVKNVLVSASLLSDPLLVHSPWNCDFEGCSQIIDEIPAGNSIELPLSHGMIVPAVMVENEADAFIAVSPPTISAIVSTTNSMARVDNVPVVAPQLEETLVCRCLAVHNPEPSLLTLSMIYLPVGMGNFTLGSN